MQDRIPTPGQEGRVLITPESGSPYYAKIEMADNPTQAGTPLNKETLLQDSTEAEIFGDTANRTVDEAFMGIMGKIALIMQNVASLTLTVTDTAGTPLQGVYVNGIFDEDGNAVATNASGQIVGYVAEGNTNLSISQYGDIENYTEQFSAVKGQSYTKTIQVTTRNFLQVTSSQNIRFSGNVEQVDVNAVGGGGAAGQSISSKTGGGGGGGYCTVQNDVSFQANQLYPAVVGSGGKSNPSSGTNGGTSSFLGVSASGGSAGVNGGQGGAGNGRGGNGVPMRNYTATNGNNGAAGTVQGFASFTEMTLYGGGGGSGGAAMGSGSQGTASGGTGGGPFGGKGGGSSGYSAGDGQSGTGFGGGGASGGTGEDNEGMKSIGDSGSGYQGCINIRMHLKSAA